MVLNELSAKRRTMELFSLTDLVNLYKNGQIEIRETQQVRVRFIKRYLLSNVIEENIYLPPLVANMKKGIREDLDTIELSIIDGSQRMKAFVQLEDEIVKALNQNDTKANQAYKLMQMLKDTKIAVQMFDNLTEEEEAQLFLDLNLKGKKVALSKRISFDSRNNLNVITNQVLHSHPQLNIAGVELEKIAVIRPNNKNLVSLSQLRQIIGIFITGKYYADIEEKVMMISLENHEYIQLVHLWLDQLFSLCPAETISDYNQSMLASFPLLIAVALYANDKMENQPLNKRKELITERMTSLQELDWSPDNHIWREFNGTTRGKAELYYLTNNKKNIEKLKLWLYQSRR